MQLATSTPSRTGGPQPGQPVHTAASKGPRRAGTPNPSSLDVDLTAGHDEAP